MGKTLAQYDCPCGHSNLEWRTRPFARFEECPICKAMTYSRVDLRRGRDAGYWTPIEQYSIAMNSDEEITRFSEKAPDVYVCRDKENEMYGVPIAHNYQQKKASLKAAGFMDLRGYG